MYNIRLRNEDGDELSFNNIGANFKIVEADGLYPPTATINTNESALIDGAMFNGSKVNMRTIKLAFTIESDAENNRALVYKVLRVKDPVTLLYTSDTRDVFIDGYVESVKIDHFAKKQVVTLTMLCPSPYFKKAQAVVNELTTVIAMFHFPFASTATPELVFGKQDETASTTIYNDGTISTGFIIELYAKASVADPKIYDYKTQEYIELDIDLEAGDLVTINTNQGEKTVTLLREGVTTNIFNRVKPGSTWLQLPAGGGVYVFVVGTGSTTNLFVTFKHNDLFEGV